MFLKIVYLFFFFLKKKNKKEIHIMHQFEEDFYGVELQAIVANFIRDEYDFKNNLSKIHQIFLKNLNLKI